MEEREPRVIGCTCGRLIAISWNALSRKIETKDVRSAVQINRRHVYATSMNLAFSPISITHFLLTRPMSRCLRTGTTLAHLHSMPARGCCDVDIEGTITSVHRRSLRSAVSGGMTPTHHSARTASRRCRGGVTP